MMIHEVCRIFSLCILLSMVVYCNAERPNVRLLRVILVFSLFLVLFFLRDFFCLQGFVNIIIDFIFVFLAGKARFGISICLRNA